VDIYALYRNHVQVPNPTKLRQHPTLIALGKAIRHVRKQQGVSQEKLALMAGIDRSYIGRVERGDNNVAIVTLQKIAQALHISLSVLMDEAEL
jgi:transcriptional regulator with XRE-family HTH domain